MWILCIWDDRILKWTIENWIFFMLIHQSYHLWWVMHNRIFSTQSVHVGCCFFFFSIDIFRLVAITETLHFKKVEEIRMKQHTVNEYCCGFKHWWHKWLHWGLYKILVSNCERKKPSTTQMHFGITVSSYGFYLNHSWYIRTIYNAMLC